MTKLYFLGTSNSIPDPEHGNTHMYLHVDDCGILIDCAGDIVQRLNILKIDLDDITDLIITHYHPDHVSGVPLILMAMWLKGRTTPLNIYGNPHTLKYIKMNMEGADWASWPKFYPVHFIEVNQNPENSTHVMSTEHLVVKAMFVKHFIPTFGLRFNFRQQNFSFAYSCDTEPDEDFADFAADVDFLIHESTGMTMGHSSSTDAAKIGNLANTRKLYLIHYSARGDELKQMVHEAREIFNGEVILAEDFHTIEF
ncbi:MAG: MBL fold metallo-hydrolase [Anaerolineaceae bacterium]|nr:MBL fold metallo-hydrolase [Anaerolineaceae bacterium]